VKNVDDALIKDGKLECKMETTRPKCLDGFNAIYIKENFGKNVGISWLLQSHSHTFSI